MYARAVDDAAFRLRELRYDERSELGLGGLALGLAVLSAEVYSPLALPLFLGGLVVGAMGVRALWRRWDLVDRLSAERYAYVIPEVLAYASRETTMDRRQSSAAMIRSWLKEPLDARLSASADDLQALASELDDSELAFDPACAVACRRLLTEVEQSPLLNPTLPAEELRSRVRQIRAGLAPCPIEARRRTGLADRAD